MVVAFVVYLSLLILFLIVPAAAQSSGNGLSGRVLSFGWDDWPPYMEASDGRNPSGIDIDLLTLIAGEAGFSTAWVHSPWIRHHELMRNGVVDGATGASWTKERARWADFSIPYRVEIRSLIVRRGTVSRFPWSTLEGAVANGMVIGYEGQSYQGEMFQELCTHPRYGRFFQKVENDLVNLKKLRGGRIDGAIMDREAALLWMNHPDWKGDFELHPIESFRAEIHLMFAKGVLSESELEHINAAIIRLKQNGKLPGSPSSGRQSTVTD